MSLVAFGSARSSPGVTTAVLAVAGTWREDRDVVVWDADADGGVLAARYRLGVDPGMISAASATRRGGWDRAGLDAHLQVLPGGVPALVGCETAAQAGVVFPAVASELAAWAEASGELDLLADCGRVTPRSPALEVVKSSTLFVMVARPRVEELRPASDRLSHIARTHRDVGWLLVGESPYGRSEVEEAFGWPVLGVVADDPRAAVTLSTGAGSQRALRRSVLMRSAATIADDLWHRAHPESVDATLLEQGEEVGS